MSKLTNQTVPKIDVKAPEVSFKYLHSMKRCLSYVHKESKKRNIDYFDRIQEFIRDYSNHISIDAACDYYCPQNGIKIKARDNTYTKNILRELKSKYPKIDNIFIKDELEHYHLKPNGKGAEVIFGFKTSNILYIVDFDLYHDFDK